MLIFMDGADNNAVFTDKWTGSVFATPSYVTDLNGRCFSVDTNFACGVLNVPAAATYIVGARHKRLGAISNIFPIVEFLDGATRQIEVHIDTDRRLKIKRNGTVLATNTSLLFSPDIAYYFEVKATIANAGGSVEVRMGGAEILSFSGDTQNSATAQITTIRIPGNPTEGNHSGQRWDDVYVCNTTGTENNDFLGDVKVETIYPSGAGSSTQFTPSAGSNFQNVDDAQSDDDTTYNGSATPGHIDLFAMGNLVTTVGTIKAIQVCNDWRKDDAGSRTMRRVLRTGGANFEGADVGMADNYVLSREILELNPDTGLPWTVAEINALEAGYKVQA